MDRGEVDRSGGRHHARRGGDGRRGLRGLLHAGEADAPGERRPAAGDLEGGGRQGA